jgi:(2Fe-2S) ferredoxin
MPKFRKHIFICQNQRRAEHHRGSCDPQGTGELQKLFKAKLSERGIRGDEVRANKSGCLEQCEHGPTVVVYPDEVWYGGVHAEDVGEIIDSHIIGGTPVERLRIAESCLNAERCPHRPRNNS